MTRMMLVMAVAVCSLLPAQTRRRVYSTSRPTDVTGQLVVTFHGKLKEIGKKEITIETEDQPVFSMGRTRQTKFLKDGKAIKPEEIPVGALLSVDVKKDPDLNPQAVTVMVDPPAPKPAEPK